MTTLKLLRIGPAEFGRFVGSLVMLLQDAVESGASVGFLAPLSSKQAETYWRSVEPELGKGRRLVVAVENFDLLGAVQLDLARADNGLHRAEVMKLFVLRAARRRGVARRLMEEIERAARAEGRSLLVLDTRRGDDAEKLYRELGYQEAGVIPRYALSSAGTLDDTVFFFKELSV